jgi:hypothetical protein
VPPTPISPELVLVDPTLARWARQQLPDHDGIRIPSAEVRRAAVAEREPPFALRGIGPAETRPLSLAIEESVHALRAQPETAAVFTDVDSRRPSARRVRVAVLATVLGVTAGLAYPGILPLPLRHASTGDALVKDERGTGPSPSPSGSEHRRIEARKATPSSVYLPLRASRLPPLVWPRVRNATGYDVEIFRGGQKVLAVRTARPRLVLPVRWTYRGRSIRLVSGSYRWYVWPLTRSQDSLHRGQPIIQAKFAISSS